MKARDSACPEVSGTPGSPDSPPSGAHGTEVKDSEAAQPMESSVLLPGWGRGQKGEGQAPGFQDEQAAEMTMTMTAPAYQ